MKEFKEFVSRNYNRLWLLGLFTVVWYGFIAPALISNKHTELVALGILGCLVPFYVIGRVVLNRINKKDKE